MSAEIRIGGKFRLGRKLGSGSFGEIFLAINLQSGEQVAIKLEPLKARHPQLLYEARLLKLLQGQPGIPNVHWYGIEGDYNIMVMDLLGPSIEDLFNYCNRLFSLKTTIMVADQMIARIEYVHSRDFIHRDIKPDNFLVGIGNKSSLIHIIDFGLSKRYRDPKTGLHIEYKTNKNLTGTARYASVNAHLGIEQGRRDDLESICYVTAYLCKGSLPWQGLPAKTKQEKYHKIMETKSGTLVENLCAGLPSQIGSLVTYAKGLKFEEQPDYNYLRRLLKELFKLKGFEYDYIFDWIQQDFNLTRKNPYLHKRELHFIYKQIHGQKLKDNGKLHPTYVESSQVSPDQRKSKELGSPRSPKRHENTKEEETPHAMMRVGPTNPENNMSMAVNNNSNYYPTEGSHLEGGKKDKAKKGRGCCMGGKKKKRHTDDKKQENKSSGCTIIQIRRISLP